MIAPAKDDLAVLDRFDRDLVSLGAHLQSKLLAFLHDAAVDDGEATAILDRDRADEKSARRHVGAGVVASGGIGISHLRGGLPANRPEGIAAGALHRERGSVFQRQLGSISCDELAGGDEGEEENSEGLLHFF